MAGGAARGDADVGERWDEIRLHENHESDQGWFPLFSLAHSVSVEPFNTNPVRSGRQSTVFDNRVSTST